MISLQQKLDPATSFIKIPFRLEQIQTLFHIVAYRALELAPDCLSNPSTSLHSLTFIKEVALQQLNWGLIYKLNLHILIFKILPVRKDFTSLAILKVTLNRMLKETVIKTKSTKIEIHAGMPTDILTYF